MPLTKLLIEKAEREKLEKESIPPPDGKHSGEGADSVLPYLTRSRESRPKSQGEAAAFGEAEKPPR